MPASPTHAAAKKPPAANSSPGVKPIGAALQTKLDVGPAGDHYEREADAVARRVMSGGDAPVSIPPTITPLTAQRKPMPSPTKEEEKPKAAGASMQRQMSSQAPDKEEKKGKSVQRRAAGPKPAKEEEKPKTAQLKAGDGGRSSAGGTASTGVESSIARMQSGGAPGMDRGTRGFMENRFGRDLSGVRVHNSNESAKAANAINARAFTVGRDVFFNRGEYKPHTRSGKELLAHELTHTVQQSGRGGVQAMRRIQRTGGTSDSSTQEDQPANSPATGAPQTLFTFPDLPGASVDINPVGQAKGTITVPQLPLPFVSGTLKGAAGADVTPAHAPGRAIPVEGQSLEFQSPMPSRDPASVPAQVWTQSTRTAGGFASGMTSKLQEMIAADSNHYAFQEGTELVYYLQTKAGSQNQIFIGTLAELVASDALLRPQWKEDGTGLFARNEKYDADHFLEMQTGGLDGLSNMWLLKASYNRSVGSRLNNNIRDNIGAVVTRAHGLEALSNDDAPQSVDEAKSRWNVRFSEVVRGSNYSTEVPYFWTRPQIARGEHLDGLKLLSEDDLIAAGVRPDPDVTPTRVRIFPTAEGGFTKTLNLRPDQSVIIPSNKELFKGVLINSATYNGGEPVDAADTDILSLDVTVMKTKEVEGEEVIERRRGPVAVKRAPRLGIAGYLSKPDVLAVARTTRFKALSPLTFSDVGISSDGALTGVGMVGSTKLMLPGLNVPLMLHGSDIRMDFPIPTENLNLGPFSITEASLGLGVGEHGFFIEGYAGFEIQGLGEGGITATAGQDGLQIEGLFNLATDFFNPASVEVQYDFANDALSAAATLGVQSGKIPGVESGQIRVAISRDSVSVTGTINLGGPLAGSSVTVGYTQEEGLTIGGTFPLPVSNLPAVQNATMTVSANRDPDSGEWSFGGMGSADLAVPGVTGRIEIGYLDGVVTLTSSASVEKGPASGTLNFTATNGAIDEDGNPVEGEVGTSITAWGRGEVSIQFGNIITGTAGVEYTQDNRIILSGSIALPPTYDLFERMEYNRNLLTIESPDFPIWGVSVGGIGVGIFAFFDATVAFESYVGPGQIRNAHVDAEMDLDRPEDATIHGEGEFYVPAFAGLSLDVGGGLRARLAVAFAQGRIGLEGQLGIEADASAQVEFDWDRTNGLAMQTTFSANARPKFRISANASVTVGVDLLLTEISHTFGPWERTLGEFGPDMTLGVDFPVRWSEAEGLDLSLDNMTVREPQIDARSLVDSVFDQLAA